MKEYKVTEKFNVFSTVYGISSLPNILSEKNLNCSITPDNIISGLHHIYDVSNINEQFKVVVSDDSYFYFNFIVNIPQNQEERTNIDKFIKYVHRLGYVVVNETYDDYLMILFKSIYQDTEVNKIRNKKLWRVVIDDNISINNGYVIFNKPVMLYDEYNTEPFKHNFIVIEMSDIPESAQMKYIDDKTILVECDYPIELSLFYAENHR